MAWSSLISVLSLLSLALIVLVVLYYARRTQFGISYRPGLQIYKIAQKGASLFQIGMNIESAERALILLDDAMRETGVPYWLSEGTALGVFRDGGLIRWDDDVDVAVQLSHRETIVLHTLPILRSSGFDVIQVRNDGAFISMYHLRLGVLVDIDMVSEDGACMALQGTKRGRFIPCTGIDGVADALVTRTFLGREFWLPSEPYYARVYGPNWMIPIK